jgi:hypothetical protein
MQVLTTALSASPHRYMAASPHGLTYYYNVETRQVPLMTTDDH